jgi:single-strand DNA-binding protein
LNKVILVGNIVRDVELTTTPSGVSVAKFTLAINRNFTNSEGERDADFIRIIVWRDLAERCVKYLAKGKKAGVCGALQSRKYDEDGATVYVTEVVASEVELLTPKGNDETEQAQAPKKKSSKELQPVDDDLPF